MINRFIYWVKCFFSLPVFFLCWISINRKKIIDELRTWENVLNVKFYNRDVYAFIRMFGAFKEYRSLVLFRLNGICKILRLFIPCQTNLEFIVGSENVGNGLIIHHGYSTVIFPEYIGKNCQIWHNVTIGRAHSGGRRPKIGDNVRICAGSVVLGGISIGDNVTIGANAVVVKDVPSNCVVVGNPAKIVRRDGISCNISL